VALQQVVDLGLASHPRVRQSRKVGEGRGPIPDIPNGNLADDKRMDSGESIVE
jgi:hypothetical protein